MPRYEYKVVPAPRRPAKLRGVRGDEARFAFTIEEAINVSAAEGWEYVRSDTLPCEHRGWFSRKVEEHSVLIFRRGRSGIEEDVPAVPSMRAASEPRLAADRSSVRRAGFASLRAAPPLTERDGEPH